MWPQTRTYSNNDDVEECAVLCVHRCHVHRLEKYVYLFGRSWRTANGAQMKPIINFTYFEFNWINFQPDIWFIASHRIVSLCAMVRMCAELGRFLMILFPLSIKHFNHHRSDRWVKRCCCCCWCCYCCWSMMLITMIFNMFRSKSFLLDPVDPGTGRVESKQSCMKFFVENVRQ